MFRSRNIYILQCVIVSSWLFLLPVSSAKTSQIKELTSLTLGLYPYLPESELRKRFTPLAEYLASQLNARVLIQMSKDYESHIERIGNNSYDISYIGPSSYISVVKKYGKQKILARLEVQGKPVFHGVIVARQESSINTIHDLNGKRIAFSSPRSTMGYMVPKYLMHKAGISLDSLKEHKFLGNHKNVALGVLLGEFDAGAVKEEVFHKYRSKGLKAITISPELSEHLFLANKNLSDKLIAKIKKTMYVAHKSKNGKKLLNKIKPTVTALVPGKDADYESLRKIVSAL